MSSDQGLFEQAKEKLSDAYDSAKTAVLGEKTTEEKWADSAKEKVDRTAEKAMDAHESYDQKTQEMKEKYNERMEGMKECGRDYMGQAGDKLHEAGDCLQSSH
uniref:Late-embryogenic-abundant n=1 Tax=Steinernema feltiae TaxID=52066 RepID=Q8MUH9_STEFE|nr:late-embryogenic-abundant [Steinernema feltiae]